MRQTAAEAAGTALASGEARGRFTFWRVVRWLLVVIVAAWLVSFGIIMAIAFWPGAP